MAPDHYSTLGVSKTAAPEEIRRAYRKLAVSLHPDRNTSSGADARFKGLTEAYETLSDPGKKGKYDREREEALRPKPAPNYPVADAPINMDLEAHEIVNGCGKTVTVSRPRRCPDCRGSGHVSGQFYNICQLCQGAGCQPCGFTGNKCCARCWGTGNDRELTTIVVQVPAGVVPHGRQKFVAHGNLWGLQGPFYIWANVGFKTKQPGIIMY